MIIIISSVFMLLIKSDSVHSLTTNDFYHDPHPISTANQEFDTVCAAKFLTVPLMSSISNLLGNSNPSSAQFDTVFVAENGFITITNTVTGQFAVVYFWYFDADCFTGDHFVVTSSNNPQLLHRAQNDIATAFNADPDVVAPTQLIMVELHNAKVDANSAQGTTVQAVIATNGQYTYLIILFASVETSDEIAIGAGYVLQSRVEIFPYHGFEAPEAASGSSNSNIPGKYIIDLNENAAPLFCPSCTQRIIAVGCQALKLKAESDGSALPLPCR